MILLLDLTIIFAIKYNKKWCLNDKKQQSNNNNVKVKNKLLLITIKFLSLQYYYI